MSPAKAVAIISQATSEASSVRASSRVASSAGAR